MSPTTSSEASISFWAPSLSTFNQVSQDDKESHLRKAELVLLVLGEEAGNLHDHHKSNPKVEVVQSLQIREFIENSKERLTLPSCQHPLSHGS